MARVLVVQHTAGEGLGYLFTWLPAAGLDVHPIHPYLGHRVPSVVEGDALIVLGGPMSAYDDTAAPWLPAVRNLLAVAVEDGVPTLGICLGAQLLAVAAGGTVDSPGAVGPELGLSAVQVAATDDLLTDAGELPVVQWHHDAVSELPDGAVLLAGSDAYPHQAFRVGDAAWGMQFHVEATAAMVASWAAADSAQLAQLGRTPADVVVQVQQAEARLEAVGEPVARRFAGLVTG
jgi:GMP synthase (glutamine-hydrolysing)